MHKDMQTMLDAAASQGCKLPVTERVVEALDQAIRDGLGATDCATLPAMWVRKAR